MTFESFTELTGATLRNRPSVSSFERVVTEAAKVKRGDLLMSDDLSEIETAIQTGVYAIVSQRDIPIFDPEIAWFSTDSFEKTLLKLLRFELLHKNVRFFLFDPVSLSYLRALAPHKSVLFLEKDVYENYRRILDAPDDTMVVSDRRDFLETVYPDFTAVTVTPDPALILLHHTLFQSTFLYRGRYYSHLRVPPLFLPEFSTVLAFCRHHNIEIDISKTPFIPHFHPFFVSRRLRLRKYGSTDHVLIAEGNLALLEREYAYLKERAGWAKIVLFLPPNLSSRFVATGDRIYPLDAIDGLQKLATIDYHFAIVAQKSAIIREFLEQQSQNDRSTPLLKESFD